MSWRRSARSLRRSGCERRQGALGLVELLAATTEKLALGGPTSLETLAARAGLDDNELRFLLIQEIERRRANGGTKLYPSEPTSDDLGRPNPRSQAGS